MSTALSTCRNCGAELSTAPNGAVICEYCGTPYSTGAAPGAMDNTRSGFRTKTTVTRNVNGKIYSTTTTEDGGDIDMPDMDAMIQDAQKQMADMSQSMSASRRSGLANNTGSPANNTTANKPAQMSEVDKLEYKGGGKNIMWGLMMLVLGTLMLIGTIFDETKKNYAQGLGISVAFMSLGFFLYIRGAGRRKKVTRRI